MTSTVASLSQQLFRMTWPMLIGLLAILSCQLVDSAFIGQLGAKPLAAVGFSIPVYQLIIGIQVGLGIATTTIISTALGADKQRYAKEFGVLVIGCGLVLIVIICLLLWQFQQSIVSTLGADAQLYPLIGEYWFPWLISCGLGAMLHLGYSIFRAHGETFTPGMIMVLTSLINLVLDPVFIFVLDLGLSGAAWATCVAFAAGCLLLYLKILQQQLICLPQSLMAITAGLRRLFSFTAPAMLSQFIPPLSAMIATALVAFYGDTAVAAWGLAIRLEFFSLIAVLSLTMAMPPIIGRLRGNGDIDQIRLLVKIAVVFVAVWQLMVAAILYSASIPLSQILTNDETVTLILREFLWVVPTSYSALGICMIMVSVSSAMGMPSLALIISALRLLACYLPLLLIGSELAGLNGLFIGAMAGNLLAGVMSWSLYRRFCIPSESALPGNLQPPARLPSHLQAINLPPTPTRRLKPSKAHRQQLHPHRILLSIFSIN